MTRRLRTTDIRDGGPADLPRIAPLMQTSFDPRYGEAWTSAQCMGMLALPGSWLTIAERGGAPIGFALARATLDEGELLLIAIDPPHRGTGAGRALLRAVVAQAHARGVRRFNLEVRSNNPAMNLYLSEGFTKVGERRDYYRGSCDELFDAVTIQKIIP
ncbi:GNAT family N-acetyltransferase [Sphingomonas sp. AX6]|uniref:GNAT family N-acetyltransferase n=1 Tax=Sphingomonas sp. AX6 TaxID=2653171 RepID=UPI0012F3758B|nr:GNAT family N-acetyltransferase [Sphingomonas sp. AX6]VXC84012.1 Ribosomal-protein-S18p-alanine acetyltransferase [Sphingomonas sp. AX6]